MFQISIKIAFSFSNGCLKKKFVRDRGSNADEIHILKLEIYKEKVNLSQNLSIPDLVVSLDI